MVHKYYEPGVLFSKESRPEQINESILTWQ